MKIREIHVQEQGNNIMVCDVDTDTMNFVNKCSA